ncbi:hypothetical protein D3C86_2161800 [compost metagenome]
MVSTQKNGTLGQRIIYQLFGTTRRLFRDHRAYICCSLVRIAHHQCTRLADKTLTEVLIN